ncbi:MAG TPA: hypothetical protein VM287_15715 [Egibacteraceae bacterium]|jgi:hypothetical protein|nr:hypothetical protein [Egibacteraceae bacterium]
MPKVTIYVAEELLAAVKEAELSMSPICQSALQREVQRVQAMKRATLDIERVAERLRNTIAEDAMNDYQQAFEMGADWARSTGTLSELRSVVEEAFKQNGLHGPGKFLSRIASVRDHLVSIETDEGGNYSFRLSSEEFARGFVDGAKAVYREVQPLL